MRALWLVALILLSILPTGQGQAGEAGQSVYTDPSGDVQVEPAGMSGDDYPNADLRALDIREVPSGFWFRASLQDMESTSEDAQRSAIEVVIPFEIRGESFELVIRQGAGTILYYSANLIHESGERLWESDSWNDDTVVLHPGESWLAAFVPRDVMTFSGPTPGPADTIAIGQVRSQAAQYFTPNGEVGILARDMMPDDPGSVDFPVRHGAVNEGASWMSATTSFRSSNGGAGGMLYNLTLHNDAEQDQLYILRAVDVDDQVTVTVPSGGITVPAGDSRQVPAYMEVPFGHQHGGYVAAIVEAHSSSSSDIARLQIGVEYLQIPQPAGHHDRLFFHDRQTMAETSATAASDAVGGNSRTRGFMNAQEDDVLDTGRPIPPYTSSTGRDPVGAVTGDAVTRYRWVIELDPRLDIGLDFRTQDQGTFQGEFESDIPMSGSFSGRLVWIGPRGSGGDPAMFSDDQATVLGRIPTADLDLTGQAPVETELALTQASDQVIYVEGSDLLLELFFNATVPRADSGDYAPQLMPGGYLDVPLNEYRDPVEDAFASTVTMELDAIDRLANPGDVLVTEVTLRTDSPTTLQLSATSQDLVVDIPGTTSVELVAGEEATVPVVVRVPHDTPLRDDVPVFFLAEGEGGTAAAILLVDLVQEPVEDDAARAAELARDPGRSSPGLTGTALIACALGVGLWIRRRG